MQEGRRRSKRTWGNQKWQEVEGGRIEDDVRGGGAQGKNTTAEEKGGKEVGF